MNCYSSLAAMRSQNGSRDLKMKIFHFNWAYFRWKTILFSKYAFLRNRLLFIKVSLLFFFIDTSTLTKCNIPIWKMYNNSKPSNIITKMFFRYRNGVLHFPCAPYEFQRSCESFAWIGARFVLKIFNANA